jgi:hypothetical protein
MAAKADPDGVAGPARAGRPGVPVKVSVCGQRLLPRKLGKLSHAVRLLSVIGTQRVDATG